MMPGPERYPHATIPALSFGRKPFTLRARVARTVPLAGTKPYRRPAGVFARVPTSKARRRERQCHANLPRAPLACSIKVMTDF